MGINGGLATHWLYPVNAKNPDKVLYEGAHTFLRTGDGVRASFRTQAPHRWFLSSGQHMLRPGHLVWIYSGGDEQEIVALTRPAKLPKQDANGTWYVELKPDLAVTKYLETHALPRALFRQVPMRAAVRANPVTAAYLEAHLLAAKTYGP